MASCKLGGTSSVNLLATYPDFNKTNCFRLDTPGGIKCSRSDITRGIKLIFSCQRATYSTGLPRHPRRFPSPIAVRCSLQNKSQQQDVSEGKKSNSEIKQKISSAEVQSLLANICDTTSIAEFKLNLGGFQLYVKRDVAGQASTSPPSLPLAYGDDTPNDIPYQNGSATSSLAIVKSETSSGEIQSSDNANSDEGLFMLPSPTVGLFWRSRSIKGKRAPPSCKEKQEVKEGQVLCYIEQFGGEIPIESDISGEVVKILREDGEPVGYGDALIAIMPALPGNKKPQLPA